MRGESQEDVAEKMIAAGLGGMQGPTVSRVFTKDTARGVHDGEFYGVTICVPQRDLYPSIKKIRAVRPDKR
eukprot:914880-Pyramimonas_sp.AAC.1